MPEVDMKMPKFSDTAVVKMPKAVDVHIPKVEMPSVDVKSPTVSGKVDIKSPKAVDITLPHVHLPTVDIKSPEIYENLDVHVSKTVDVDVPQVKMPAVDIKTPVIAGKVDVKLPESIAVDVPTVDISKHTTSFDGAGELRITTTAVSTESISKLKDPKPEKPQSFLGKLMRKGKKDTPQKSLDIDIDTDVGTKTEVTSFLDQERQAFEIPDPNLKLSGTLPTIDARVDVTTTNESADSKTPSAKSRKSKKPKSDQPDKPEGDVVRDNVDIKFPTGVDVSVPQVDLPTVDVKTPTVFGHVDVDISKTVKVDVFQVDIPAAEIKMPHIAGELDVKTPQSVDVMTAFETADSNTPSVKSRKSVKPKTVQTALQTYKPVEIKLGSIEDNSNNSNIDDYGLYQPAPLSKSCNLVFLCDYLNRIKDAKSSFRTAGDKEKFRSFTIVYEEYIFLLTSISAYIMQKERSVDSVLNADEISSLKRVINDAETQVDHISKLVPRKTCSPDEYEEFKVKLNKLQSKTVEIKKLFNTSVQTTEAKNSEKLTSSIDKCIKNIDKYKSEFEHLKKGKFSQQDKLVKGETLLESIQVVIEELYDNISIHKLDDNYKHSLPDDVYRTLKTAKKLQKEIENANSNLVKDLEKDVFLNVNSKEFYLLSKSSVQPNQFPSKDKVENIQEHLDKCNDDFALVTNLKLTLDPQKTDKNVIKKLDSDLNNIQSNIKTLLSLQCDYTHIENILNKEQKWFDQFNQSNINLQDTTSTNYNQRLTQLQTLITEISVHYDKLVHLQNIISELEEHTNTKPLKQTYEKQINNLFNLRNSLRADYSRLLTFKTQFDQYKELKTNTESALTCLVSNSEHIKPNQDGFSKHAILSELENISKMLTEANGRLNESIDVLPITDIDIETDALKALKIIHEEENTKSNELPLIINDEDIAKRLHLLESTVEKPMNTISDHNKTLRNVLYEITIIESTTTETLLIKRSNALRYQCDKKLSKAVDLQIQLNSLREDILQVNNNLSNTDMLITEITNQVCVDRQTLDAYIKKTNQTISDDLEKSQKSLSLITQNFKQIKDDVKHYKKERKSFESDLNETEKRCKLLKTKQTDTIGKLETKLQYWILVDELIQNIKLKTCYIKSSTQVTLDSDILADKNLETIIKHLKDVRNTFDKENKSIVGVIENLHKKDDKHVVDGLIDDEYQQWTAAGAQLKELNDRLGKTSKILHNYRQLKESTGDWINGKLASIDTSDDVSDKTKAIEKQKEHLAELRNMITDIGETMGLGTDDLPLDEVEELSVKLEKIQKVLASLGDVSDKKNKMTNDLENAKRLLHDMEKSSPKSIKVNEESLKELRTKLLSLNNSKKDMDESLDVDNFYVPLNEKRTYSIIEVFQLWQQIFKETFEQYRRLSCSLLENEDNNTVFELWHDYLMYVQEFLSSPVPGDYHSLTSHERLCQVHQEVLSSQMENLTTCINKPTIINEPDLIKKITSLTETHNDVLTRLETTHQEIWTRIGHWREYRRTIKTVYEWLWKIENIHTNLNLKFINVRRLPQLKLQIHNLLSSLTMESSQVEDLEQKQNVIFTFCNKETETGHRKELIAISQRTNEIQASLEIWNGYLIKIEKLTNSFNQETTDIDEVLEDVQSQLEQLLHELDSVNKNTIPSDRLINESKKIQDMSQRLTLLDSKFLIADDTRNELKDSLDPIEIRTFGQKLRFLKYHQKDIQHQLFLLSCRLDNLTLKPQEFTERSTKFIHWAVDMDSQLTSLTKSLSDPKFATEILKPEFESQIDSKQNEYNWLNNTGHQLIDNESKLNPELAHTTKEKLKEIDEKWVQLKYSIHKHTLELPSKILHINKLFGETNLLKSWITDTESKVTQPIIFADSSEETFKKELKRIEDLKNMLKEKQAEYNSLLVRCNKQLEGETSSDKSLANVSQLESSLKTLSMSWEILERTVERQNSEILTYREELKNTNKIISAEHECIDRLKATLSEYNHLRAIELNNLANTVNTFEREQQNEKETWSKLERATQNPQSTYTVKFIEEEIEIITKTRISLEKEISSTLIVLKKSLKLWKDFTNSHRKAVITLTQIDTKLTQLEVLGNTDNVGLKKAKEFENLQVLEEKLRNIEEHLESTDALGEQLIKESTPNDIKCIQEMIDEYQMLWKDINGRISKQKSLRANEISYNKKQSINEEVQVETLIFGKDFQGQVDTLPTELLKKESFQNELSTAMSNATRNVNNLETAIQNSDKNLSRSVATCQMSIDLIKHLSVILKTQCGVTKIDPNIVQCEQILEKYEDLTAKVRSQQLTTQTSVTNCPLCSEQNWSQFDNDMWRLEHWIQSTEAKLSILPIMPPTNIEQLEDVIQEHREVLLYLDSHRSIVKSLNVIGEHLAEHSSDKERAEQIKNHLSATNSRWDRVSLACTEWQTKLQSALMENEEFYEMIDELVTWLDKTEHTIKTNEPIDLSETTEVITKKFHKFKNIHKELERCEPRVVSLLEASDWLRQVNEKSGLNVSTDDDQNIINSHSRLSHLRARVNALINMTGDYTINLGTVLGYDMTPENTCRRLHQVDDTSTVLNQTDEGESNTNAGEETVLRRGYQFFGRVMRASLPFQALMLLVLGAASMVPVVDEEFSCMESNNIVWSLYPLLRYPGGPPPV